jgi:hypothetical protein
MPNNQPGAPPPGGYQRPPGVPPDATADAYGNWFDAKGNYVGVSNAQAETPAQKQLDSDLAYKTEPGTGKTYIIENGKKWYIPPSGPMPQGGGGLIHGHMQWNGETGEYDAPLDWGKLLSYVAAGIITAGAADAALSSSPALAASAGPDAASQLSTATLASNAAVPAGVSDVGAGAATASYGAEGAAPLAASTTVPTAAGTIAGGTGLGATALDASATVPTAAYTATGGTGLTAGGTAGDGSLLGGVGGAAGAGSAVGGAAGGGSLTGDLLKYAIPTAGNIVGGLIQANATSNASAAQQKYLEEALAYEKQRDAAAIALEGSRYANYSGNIAPYLATSQSAGTRMSSLLGLPANAAPTTTQPSTVNYQPSATSTAAGSAIGAPTAAVTTGSPLPRATDGTVAPMVTMKAPDGSTKQVNAQDVPHYQSMGAQVVSA